MPSNKPCASPRFHLRRMLALALVLAALFSGASLHAMETTEVDAGHWLMQWIESLFGASEGEAGPDMDPDGISSAVPSDPNHGEAGPDMDPDGAWTPPADTSR
ncbi:MAG: hypothetical protein AAF481_02890 [Acidobacteriota bacterium]